jgi:hypothetical protein
MNEPAMRHPIAEQPILTEIEAKEIPERLIDILTRHKGVRNAITGAKLSRMFGHRNDRKIRMVIQQLIADGKPIAASVSDPVGYYLVETPQEAEAYEAVLRSRAVKTFERLHDFQRAAKNEFGIPFQPALLTLGDE